MIQYFDAEQRAKCGDVTYNGDIRFRRCNVTAWMIVT